MSDVEFKFCQECFGATWFIKEKCELCVKRLNKQKQDRLRAFQKFLKKQILWKQGDPDFNMAREYQNEPLVVLEGRDFKNPLKLSTVHFVQNQSYVDAIFKWNPSFYQICIDMGTLTITQKNYRSREPEDRWWCEVKE